MADYTVTPASVLPGAAVQYATDKLAGEAITAGQPVYLKAADSKWYKSDANAAAPANTVDGIAVNSAPGAGQPLKVAQRDDDFTPGFTIAAGEVVVVSATAGGLAPVADLATGMYPLVIGVGKGSNKIVLNCGSGALKGTTVMP